MIKIKIYPTKQNIDIEPVEVEIDYIEYNQLNQIYKYFDKQCASQKQISNAVAKSFVYAVKLCPDSNPSDIWQHIIYRHFLDYGMSDQQWKRVSGFALERAFIEIYNPIFPQYDLIFRTLPKKEAKQLFKDLGFGGQIKHDKIDAVVELAVIFKKKLIAGVHVKASLAERIQDDVPASLALMSKGYLSIFLTMDSKSYPPPHGNGVNYGELGGRSWGDDRGKVRIKREYIEENGQFDALISYNKRTPESPSETKSGKKIYSIGFNEKQPDVFVKLEAVQQFKIGRKRKVNRALNPKRSKIFGVKSNCETASLILEYINRLTKSSIY